MRYSLIIVESVAVEFDEPHHSFVEAVGHWLAIIAPSNDTDAFFLYGLTLFGGSIATLSRGPGRALPFGEMIGSSMPVILPYGSISSSPSCGHWRHGLVGFHVIAKVDEGPQAILWTIRALDRPFRGGSPFCR
jgi:hypothetical protein